MDPLPPRFHGQTLGRELVEAVTAARPPFCARLRGTRDAAARPDGLGRGHQVIFAGPDQVGAAEAF